MALSEQKNNPLHGLTLEFMVKQLFFHYGWEEMGSLINVDCFRNNPSQNRWGQKESRKTVPQYISLNWLIFNSSLNFTKSSF